VTTPDQDASTFTLRRVQAMLGLSRHIVSGLIDAGFVTPTRGRRNEWRFTFQDLMLLRTAHALQEQNIPARRILRSLARLKATLPAELPLSGLRITAIGGSDSHIGTDDPRDAFAGTIGTPTTVVHAGALSMEGILDGIRAGHVFVDAEGTRDRSLDVLASAGATGAGMGDALQVANGATMHVVARTAALEGQHVVVTVDGKPLASAEKPIPANGEVSFDWTGDGKRHWLRVDVRSPQGKLLILGNPVYVNH